MFNSFCLQSPARSPFFRLWFQAVRVPAARHLPGRRRHSPPGGRRQEAVHRSGGGQHGRSPQPLLRHRASADVAAGHVAGEAREPRLYVKIALAGKKSLRFFWGFFVLGATVQPGSHPRSDQHGPRASHPVLQGHPLQAHSHHLLPRRCVRGTDETGELSPQHRSNQNQ